MPKLRKIHVYCIFIHKYSPKFFENGSITDTCFKTGSWSPPPFGDHLPQSAFLHQIHICIGSRSNLVENCCFQISYLDDKLVIKESRGIMIAEFENPLLFNLKNGDLDYIGSGVLGL